MEKRSIKVKFKRNLAGGTAVLLILLALLPVQLANAEGSSVQGAKTPPPPIEAGLVQPFGVFDPNHKYLDSGSATLSNDGGGKVVVSGRTTAKQTVDTVGVSTLVQRWTGSAWVDVGSTSTSTATNRSTVYGSESRELSTGYYYRIKSTHWAKQGDTTEQGVKYTGSILVN